MLDHFLNIIQSFGCHSLRKKISERAISPAEASEILSEFFSERHLLSQSQGDLLSALIFSKSTSTVHQGHDIFSTSDNPKTVQDGAVIIKACYA